MWSNTSWLLEYATGLPHVKVTCHKRTNLSNNFLLPQIFHGAATLYSGQKHDDNPFQPQDKFNVQTVRSRKERQCTAVVTNDGICLWIDALESPTTEPASVATTHVALGQIVFKDRNCVSVWDSLHISEQVSGNLTPVHFLQAPITSLKGIPDQPHFAPRIVASERAESGVMNLVYELNSKTMRAFIQPGLLTERTLMATARVPCPRAATCSDTLVVPCWQRRSGWRVSPHQRFVTPPCPSAGPVGGIIWNTSSPQSKLLAIEGCKGPVWRTSTSLKPIPFSTIVMRPNQCMACMTRFLMTFEDEALWEQYLYYKQTKLGVPTNPLHHHFNII